VIATNSEKILPPQSGTAPLAHALYDVAYTRQLEGEPLLPTCSASLMQRAGLAIARLAIALAPHARSIWIACGPGNNGGDGLEAAAQLARLGKVVTVSHIAGARPRRGDALQALRSAQISGVRFSDAPPPNFDFCVDALFGIGKYQDFGVPYDAWIAHINASGVPVLAVDVPSGLHADTGVASHSCIRANFTLSLLTLKSGLFTGDGRAKVGDVWFNALREEQNHPSRACANLITKLGPASPRLHNTHKGSFGDVSVIGGDHGMVGAAILAGRAALFGGAGRVFIGLLASPAPSFDEFQPELMLRDVESLPIQDMTVVAGCGGGHAILQQLRNIVLRAKTLVLDADALNHLALSTDTQSLLPHRIKDTTVLTPHPLEAARLLTASVSMVQANRLSAAQTLAERWNCVVVLKGSGTVIARPGGTPTINATGNGRLATAGTGDVLAGLIGSYLAQGMDAFDAACMGVSRHGHVADTWPANAGHLTASGLAQAL
jgi:hydroxyethylthiazole kinase-like uncharacterized protein yjeF